MKIETKRNFEHVLHYMHKYKSSYFVVIGLMIIRIIVSVISPFLMQKIIDDAIVDQNVRLLIILSLTLIFISLIDGLVSIVSRRMTTKLGKQVAFDIRIDCMKHLSRMSGRYITNKEPGEIFVSLYGDINNIEMVATNLLFSSVSDGFIALGITIYLAIQQFDLLLFVLAIQPFVLLLQGKYGGIIGKLSEKQRDHFGMLTSLLDERVSNLLAHIINKTDHFFYKKYIPVEKSIIEDAVSIETHRTTNNALLCFLSVLMSGSILCIGGIKVIRKTFTLGGIMAFMSYSQRLLAPLISLMGSRIQLQEAYVSIRRVFGILDTPIEIDENLSSTKQITKGKIEFRNVEFGYTDEKKVLEDICITFEGGKSSAVIGETGCGKSTLSCLIYKLWNVDKGEIFIDDSNINEYSLEELRKNISIVTQDAYLFNDSIRNNILLGGNVEEDKLKHIIKCAKLDKLISSLPDGIDTLIGEKGIRLSGGEKQRIAIARALFFQPQIVVFDESTSALDNNTEREIMESIQLSLKGHTLIFITHRLSSITDVDRIFVISGGKVVISGRHDELMDESEYYRSLYERSKIGDHILDESTTIRE